jgi:DNA-binding YbaB/EbfC family protein
MSDQDPQQNPDGDAADLGGLLGGVDLGGLLDAAQSMQSQMAAAQAELESAVIEGQAGGGAVRIEATGLGEFRSVLIRPDAFDPDDASLLEDLVLAALHDVAAKMGALAAQSSPMGGLDLGGDLGGLDLGGLGLGGPDEGGPLPGELGQGNPT